MPTHTYTRETSRALDACRRYLDLGPGRSLPLVRERQERERQEAE